ncbi:MAG: DUF285 domain-containing protein [Bacteroidales bacterium]|nr:DUF285 domain-containing protein [Bacteroidales bacterium]
MTIALLILAAVAAIVLITRMNKNSKDGKRKQDPYKDLYGKEDANVYEHIDEEKEASDNEDEEDEEEPAETEDGNPFLPEEPYAPAPETITQIVFGWKKDYPFIVSRHEMIKHQGQTNKIETYIDHSTLYILSDYEMYVPKKGILFGEFVNATEIEFHNFNTRYVTDMCSMFENCEKLEKLDLSGFDTSNVEDMTCMFCECKSLKEVNLRGVNTGKVELFKEMFSGCESLESIDLSGFDTRKSFDMTEMFVDCENLETIYASDTFVAKESEAKYMEENPPIFGNCQKLCATDAEGNKFRFSESKLDYRYARIFDKAKGVEGYFTMKQ